MTKGQISKLGFTLIEMIVVILLLGILVALILPRIPGVTGDAATNVEGHNLAMIQKQIDLFSAKNEGNYPPNPLEGDGAGVGYDFCFDSEYFGVTDTVVGGCPKHKTTDKIWCVEWSGDATTGTGRGIVTEEDATGGGCVWPGGTGPVN